MVSWAWRGIGACLSIVDGLFFISFHVAPWWNKVIIIFQNAGSMKDHVRTYIHELLGVPQSCVHYINCSKCGSVARARYFFTSSSTAILPTSTFSPFDNGWSPAVKPATLEPRVFRLGFVHEAWRIEATLSKLPLPIIPKPYFMTLPVLVVFLNLSTPVLKIISTSKFQKVVRNGHFSTFWLDHGLRATAECNFSFLIWRHGSAPAALASLVLTHRTHKSLWKHSMSRLSEHFSGLYLLSSDFRADVFSGV